jgi:hypothetical protein
MMWRCSSDELWWFLIKLKTIFTYFGILTTTNFCCHKVDTTNDMELHTHTHIFI